MSLKDILKRQTRLGRMQVAQSILIQTEPVDPLAIAHYMKVFVPLVDAIAAEQASIDDAIHAESVRMNTPHLLRSYQNRKGSGVHCAIAAPHDGPCRDGNGARIDGLSEQGAGGPRTYVCHRCAWTGNTVNWHDEGACHIPVCPKCTGRLYSDARL